MIDCDALFVHGYTEFALQGRNILDQLQACCEQFQEASPRQWHLSALDSPRHIEDVRKLSDRIVALDLVPQLLKENVASFIPLLGPDINAQRVPHLRVSRPNQESDFVDWHRDTFYGNSPWELNLWFPLYPLQDGAGIRIVPGSHRAASENIRDAYDDDPFRTSVTKGSVANQMGYLYQPKTDDSIVNLRQTDSVLIAPRYGSAVLFFGSCVHRAQNNSCETRVSIDLRLCNMHTKTECKPDYYKPLSRGVVYQAAREFLQQDRFVGIEI